ncbi:MAG: hypothetical protein E3K32_01965 [wastewater metagenome]|nr:hypothetical protein [Candidatus Loosdrechtia aerotolerans]
MKNKDEKTIYCNGFSGIKEAEQKINAWIEEDYNKQRTQTQTIRCENLKEFEKNYYKCLMKNYPGGLF